ncbi:MAG: N-acetylmuramoyl-L-alanine amidase [Clostridia bacterium]|nr:N-acetylmuramoyl-L-alanine amidase [Clostridia bacterium]
MRNLLITLSCIFVMVVFSLFSESSEMHAADIVSSRYPLEAASVEKKNTISDKLNKASDFKFPSRTVKNGGAVLNPWKGSKLVVIDPGHGGDDPGANSGKILEKDINLDVALRLETLLKSYNIPTYITRNDDRFIELYDRIKAANERNAALFVSIHCNWFKYEHLNGVMTLYFPSENLRAGFLCELDYAKLLQSELAKSLGTKDLGIEDRTDLAVLRHANMPTALVELGFLSNYKEAKLLASGDFKQKAAEGIAEGIRKSLIKMTVYKGKKE